MAQQWHYRKNDQTVGPVSAKRLKELASSGALLPTDLVWTEQVKEWKQARLVKGLFPLESDNSPTGEQPLPKAAVSPEKADHSPPQTGSEVQNWLVQQNNQMFGPFTFGQLQSAAAAGQLRPGDLVADAVKKNWEPARTVSGLSFNTTSSVIPPHVKQNLPAISSAMIAVVILLWILAGRSGMTAKKLREFGDNPTKYKGQTLTVKAEYYGSGLAGYIENGVLPVELYVPFRVSGSVNGGYFKYAINVRVAKGSRVPPFAPLDDAVLTFKCTKGELDDGNEAIRIVRP